MQGGGFGAHIEGAWYFCCPLQVLLSIGDAVWGGRGWKSVVVPVVVHRTTYAGGGLSWGWVLGSTGLEAGHSSSYCWQNHVCWQERWSFVPGPVRYQVWEPVITNHVTFFSAHELLGCSPKLFWMVLVSPLADVSLGLCTNPLGSYLPWQITCGCDSFSQFTFPTMNTVLEITKI